MREVPQACLGRTGTTVMSRRNQAPDWSKAPAEQLINRKDCSPYQLSSRPGGHVRTPMILGWRLHNRRRRGEDIFACAAARRIDAFVIDRLFDHLRVLAT